MLQFKEFIKENQSVYLDGVETDKSSISRLNRSIERYIKSVYGPFGFVHRGENIDIDVNGMILNTEYIGKMINNYTVFKRAIKEFNLKDSDSFYRFMFNNMKEVYHYDSDFFKRYTLPILINTTRKGNVSEKRAKEIFKEFAESKNIIVDIKNPILVEDVDGIDFKFTHNGKEFTVQVKPFISYERKGSEIYIKSQGSLSLITNYLVLCKGENFIILKNPSNKKIWIIGDEFVTDESNILQII